MSWVGVMTQHRKVGADENIFVNKHNERQRRVTGRNGEIMQRRGTRSPGAASRVGRLQSAQWRASGFSLEGPNISLCQLLYSLQLVQNIRKTGQKLLKIMGNHIKLLPFPAHLAFMQSSSYICSAATPMSLWIVNIMNGR